MLSTQRFQFKDSCSAFWTRLEGSMQSLDCMFGRGLFLPSRRGRLESNWLQVKLPMFVEGPSADLPPSSLRPCHHLYLSEERHSACTVQSGKIQHRCSALRFPRRPGGPVAAQGWKERTGASFICVNPTTFTIRRIAANQTGPRSFSFFLEAPLFRSF